MSNIIDSIQLSGVTYQIQGSGGGGVPESTFTAYTATTDERISQDEEVTAAGLNALNDKITPTVELTQAQYDALVDKDPNTYYIITDAQAGDLTNYYTKSETNTLLAGKQATLVSGTNIKTVNSQSLLGSGNIDIQGGSTYTAGRGIDITNDTISFSLPISAGTGNYSIIEGGSTTASGHYSHAEGINTNASSTASHAEGQSTSANGITSHAEGYYTIAYGYYSHTEGQKTSASSFAAHAEGINTNAIGQYSHAEGNRTTASGNSSHAEGHYTTASTDYSHAEGSTTTASGVYAHAEGKYTIAQNEAEHASGRYNVSSKANTTFGDSGNTLFSIGNGYDSEYRHNVLDIRQNGDIYIADTNGSGDYDGKPMIKLQDAIGGMPESTFTAYTASTESRISQDEEVTAAALNVLNETLSDKADSATTLAGYGITNAYTKTEIDNKIGDIETLLAAI